MRPSETHLLRGLQRADWPRKAGIMHLFRVALAQIDSTVGDLDGNAAKIAHHITLAREAGADLVAFPELALTGYPPEDLLLRPHFVQDNLSRLRELAAGAHGVTAVVGFVDADGDIHNAAAVLHGGVVAGVYRKVFLPNYGVFDEERYFQPGREQPLFVVSGVTVGVSICEDMWYPTGPAAIQARAGARVLININASPYQSGKRDQRERMLATRALDNEVIVGAVYMVGGQDELIFDGASVVFDQTGRLVARGRQFEEDLVLVDLDVDAVFRSRLHDPRVRKEAPCPEPKRPTPILVLSERPPAGDPASAPAGPELPPRQEAALLDGPAEIYAALVLGTRDYVRKNGFVKVVIGLSGGVDSALVATIAADALGPENVLGVTMPSRYSSEGSVGDSRDLARRLGIGFAIIPIEPAFQAFLHLFEEPFRGTEPGVAEENIQARIRGNILMAYSNKYHHLVLTAGNKSEVATGYATLYGADTTGALSPIKDVYKTTVYRLCEYRNSLSEVIPRAILEKAPSAELKPDQKDTDTLPPYPVLDPILQAYVEEDQSVEDIIGMGHPEELVRRLASMVDRSEYKRRQSPPGLKVTPRAFGRDRRLPITNRYRQ